MCFNDLYYVQILFPIEAAVVESSISHNDRNNRNPIQHTETLSLLCRLFFQLVATINKNSRGFNSRPLMF